MSKKEERFLSKTIKLEFLPDKFVENELKNNCRYRHFLYNKCVEIVKSMEENHSEELIGDFSKYDLLGYIRDLYESNIIYSFRDELRPDWMEEYDYYFRGISECVVDDVCTTINVIKHHRKIGESSDINFSPYNPNHLTFRFKNKVRIDDKYSTGNRIVLTENPYIIGLKINNTQRFPMAINLKESISHVKFDIDQVREIAIKFHNEKWYLCLIIRDYEYDTNIIDMVDVNYHRKKVAGIDLGEENPVVIYNGKSITHIPKHLQFPKERVDKVNKRISRLQACLDRKYNPDMDKFHQSKNYYKVLKKFHKAWEHLVNIKKDWHFKLAHWIVTHYKTIVVDEFHGHIIKKENLMNATKRKDCNYSMQNKSMYDFTQRLIHMCHKYGTNYYRVIKHNKESKTTNTCCVCGYENKNKLTLNKRIFKCESCGYTINRDINAAINCYNLYKNKSIRKLFLELI